MEQGKDRKARRITSAFVAAGLTLGVAGGLAALTTTSSNAATAAGCTAVYSTTRDSGSGFGAQVVITDDGPAWSNWTLSYSYAGNQTLQNGWNGTWAQSGKTVTVTSAAYNGAVAAWAMLA